MHLMYIAYVAVCMCVCAHVCDYVYVHYKDVEPIGHPIGPQMFSSFCLKEDLSLT